ncbi:MAG: LysM peptidoglycan-binding domain-containing protein [Bacteroidetes bacterium]|nr:LysM peptidoglycan-binding domain-containing protein [Bacteroidota bacterium]MBS1932330.1 LysM peptidoglycan-binding domain-containing protein [Bacteroidota bacterium]
MQNRKLLLLIIVSFISRLVLAQDPATIEKYINTYKEIAIQEMQRTGVPAAIKLAQGIHETLAGTSDLVKRSNNHFGIKCKDTWTGASVKHDDDLKNECFRKYNSAEASYRDHSDFLKGSSRYAFLFKLNPTDYKDWAYGLKKAGYATNPKYPQIIIKLIEDYHLEDYTLIAMGKMKPTEEVIAKADPDITQQSNNTIAAASQPVFLEQTQGNPVKSEMKTLENKKIEIKAVEKNVAVKPNYPPGEFKINETRVIYAKKGTPLLAIAQQYNISLAWLYDFNDLPQTETLQNDQLVYLQRKRKIGQNEKHIVKQGENLYDIAQQEAIRMESLLDYNMLLNDMQPAVGELLYLRSKAPARPKLALKENYSLTDMHATAAVNSNVVFTSNPPTVSENNDQLDKQVTSTIVYTVQPKETIWAIAQKYKVSIDELVKWNQLDGQALKAGQHIKIYK